MRSFALPFALAILAAPAPGWAADLSGRIGLFYDRYDTWTPDLHTSSPRLQLDGSLAAGGSLVEPEYGSWRGQAGYQRVRNTYSDSADETRSLLTYSANLSVLNGNSPALLSLSADRRVVDASTTSGTVALTGTQTDTTYGGQVDVRARSAPLLTIGAWQLDSRSDGFGIAPVEESSKLLRIGTQHGPGAYDFKLSYEGRWNSGTLDIRDYTSHTFGVNASAPLGGGLVGFITGGYFQRLPNTESRSNPRYEQNQVTTGVRNGSDNVRGQTTYTYDHQFFSSQLTGEMERIRQMVSGRQEIEHSAAWVSIWSANVSTNQDRANGLEDSSYGASFGPAARWRHGTEGRNLWIQAGPIIGVLKDRDGSTELGSGAQWRGWVGWDRSVLYSLDYSGQYANNLFAVRGWSLQQALTGDASGVLGKARARAAVTVSALRQHQDFMSQDSAARDVVARGSLEWRRASLALEGGLRDGTSLTIGGVRGDGLFIPSAFDSHSQSVSASGTVLLAQRMTAIARARYARLSGPEVPDQREASLHGILEYALGQVVLSLEDRYTVGGPAGFDLRVNEVMVRISRSFDLRN